MSFIVFHVIASNCGAVDTNVGIIIKTAHLFQRLSVALQRFNAVCVFDTFAGMSEPDAE
jgi:hypothetical protein